LATSRFRAGTAAAGSRRGGREGGRSAVEGIDFLAWKRPEERVLFEREVRMRKKEEEGREEDEGDLFMEIYGEYEGEDGRGGMVGGFF
jgi:hypothetical protein